jgi:YD repeat-containing protein
MSYPNQKSVDYTYDINGNIHTTKDPNGTITTYTYDALGRNTRKDYTLGSGVGGITWESYAYDALGRLIATTDSLSHDTTFLYDTVGNLVSETNANKTTTYTYDALGRRTSMTTPLGRTLTYIYDDIGRISEIREGSGVIVSYGYNPMSLLHTTLANGINTDREYDDANRLSKIGATSLSYDAHGNIISR